MTSDDEGSTIATCPQCGARVALTPEQTDFDEGIVNCPKCGEPFDWERPAK
jgi:predicted Zn finger-like uncharacterized protein